MPQDLPLSLTGNLTGTAARAVLEGLLDPGGAAVATLEGTLSAAVVDSWSNTTIISGVRVKLDGQWLEDHEIIGAVDWRESIDSHRKSARLMLAGRSLAVTQTLRTWTRKPAELWTYQGPPGNVRETLELRGHVVPGSTQAGGADPLISIEIDATGAYDEPLCVEIAPDAGLTRGAIARALAASAGLESTRIPDGEAYDRPVVAADRDLWRTLKELGEPLGWAWRIVPEGEGVALEAYVPRLKTAPEQPDAVWTPADWDSIAIKAPDRPLSRVIVRGLVAVTIDEAGIETEVRKVTVTETFVLDRAVEEQLATGEIVPIGDPATETTAVRLEVITTVKRQAGKELEVITRERTWHNPKGAVLRTPKAGEPDGPVDGYYFCRSYIDPAGEYVRWRSPRFGDTSERRVTNAYHPSNGQLTSTTTDVYGWYAQSAGVKQTLTLAWVVDVSVGTGDESYLTTWSSGDRRSYEKYGLAERHVATPTYGDQGAIVTELQRSFGFVSPRAAIDVADHYLLYSGAGQADAFAPFQLEHEITRREEISAGLVLSRSESQRGFFIQTKRDGTFDYGGGERSHRIQAVFRTFRTKSEVFTYRTDGGVDALILEPGAAPRVDRVTTPPAPRYRLSPWTVLRQHSAEAVFDDPAIAELFGTLIQVVKSDTMTSVSQALERATRIAERSRSLRVTVSRLLTWIRPGDTVLLLDPDHGLAARGLVVDLAVRHEVTTGARNGTYDLEVLP